MKIAVSGAHSTGKTTLIDALGKDPSFKDFKIFSGITRRLKEEGYKINEEGDSRTQIRIMEIHAENSKAEGDILYDRSILDPFVYTSVLYDEGKIEDEALGSCLELYLENIDNYDIIFYLEPEFDMVDDGVRTTDIGFRDKVAKVFGDIMAGGNDLYGVPLVKITGTVEERVAQIKEAIDNK